ncbi:MAG: metalloregulator ArsR/SmtB family transcription factor [Actinomycetota bacterium]
MSRRANQVFSALADPTRRQILEWFDGAGAATATELTSRLPMSRQAITKHLKELERAGLVSSVREGRETRYSGTGQGLDEAAGWLAERSAAWGVRLSRLAEASEDDPSS